MKPRLSKIAQLPKSIRDQLNHRLENGKQGPELLKWLNALSETKELLAEKFEGRPITHQNLSEWRRGGYQDWLQHQRHIEWFDHFSENGTELAKHDRCDDSFEAMGRLFLVEIGQGLAALQNLKNPHERSLRLQNLLREFARLQNAFNFSRKIQLDFDKYQYDRPGTKPEPQIEEQDEGEPKSDSGAPTYSRLTAPTSPEPSIEPPAPESEAPTLGAPAPRRPDAPTSPEPPTEPSALQPSSSTPAFQPIPTPSPTTPPQPPIQPPIPYYKHKVHSIPIRGRRFVCVEG